MTDRSTASPTSEMYPALARYLDEQTSHFEAIPVDRRDALAEVASYIHERITHDQPAKLTFICTHNSRRSHLSQIWAQIAAAHYGLQSVHTFSGGTEATAFNPRAVAALQRSGLKIIHDDLNSTNPRYTVFSSDTATGQVCFSKVYDAPPNPTEGYCAIMTCSQADEACPLVMGCDLRIPIRYEDPKVADGTPFEAQRYDERSAQICAEMLYMMSCVARMIAA